MEFTSLLHWCWSWSRDLFWLKLFRVCVSFFLNMGSALSGVVNGMQVKITMSHFQYSVLTSIVSTWHWCCWLAIRRCAGYPASTERMRGERNSLKSLSSVKLLLNLLTPSQPTVAWNEYIGDYHNDSKLSKDI